MDPKANALSDELEAHGLDPDGFHEDEDAVDDGSVSDPGDGGSPVGDGVLHGVVPGGLAPEEPASGVHPVVKPVRGRRPAPKREPTTPALSQPGAAWGAPGEDGRFVLGVSVREVGCFLVKPEDSDKWKDRWRVFNKLTGFEHVTYGALEDVNSQLLLQTKSWEEKLQGGSAKRSSFNTHYTQKNAS